MGLRVKNLYLSLSLVLKSKAATDLVIMMFKSGVILLEYYFGDRTIESYTKKNVKHLFETRWMVGHTQVRILGYRWASLY